MGAASVVRRHEVLYAHDRRALLHLHLGNTGDDRLKSFIAFHRLRMDTEETWVYRTVYIYKSSQNTLPRHCERSEAISQEIPDENCV